MSLLSAFSLSRHHLLLKELRTRMRSKVGMLVANLYVLALSLYMLWFFFTEDGFGHALGSDIGDGVCRLIAWTQMWIILIICPLITASAITSEQEQKTFDSLWVAPVTVWQIVSAKLVASLGYFCALLCVSLPLMSLSFILGGVSPATILAVYLLTAVQTVLIGALGFYWSTRFQRSIAAIPAAGICVLSLAILPPILNEFDRSFLLTLSPVSALSALFDADPFPFFRYEIAAWIPAVILPILPAIYFIRASVIRLQFPAERRHVGQRLIFGLFLLLLVLCSFGIRFGSESDGTMESAITEVLELLFIWSLLLVPWLGASYRVADSEKGKTTPMSLSGFARRCMLHPGRFLTLVYVGIALLLFIAVLVDKRPLRTPLSELGLAFFGAMALGFLCWSRFMELLTRGRSGKMFWFMLVIGYVVIGAFTVTPLVLESALRNHMGELNGPAPVQFIAFLSPGAGALRFERALHFSRAFPAVKALLGEISPLWITAGFHAVLLFIFSLIPTRPTRP